MLSGRGSYSWPLGRGGEGGRQVGTRGQEGHLALPVNQKRQSRLTQTQWPPGDSLQWAHGRGGTPTPGPGADLTLLSPSAEKGGHVSTRRCCLGKGEKNTEGKHLPEKRTSGLKKGKRAPLPLPPPPPSIPGRSEGRERHWLYLPPPSTAYS